MGTVMHTGDEEEGGGGEEEEEEGKTMGTVTHRG